jgi:hypothetical protein
MTTAVRRRGALVRWPALLPSALAAAGWVVLAAPAGVPHAHGARWPDAGTVAMVVAMMAPLAVPGARTVARCSIWWSGRAAVAVFTAVFLACWVLFACLLGVGVGLLSWAVPPAAVASLALVGAAVAQFDPGRPRLLDACGAPARIRAAGRGAVVDAARFGRVSAVRCLSTCALPMAGMLAIPAHGVPMLAATAALCGLAVVDRADRDLRGPVAAGYLFVAVVVLL